MPSPCPHCKATNPGPGAFCTACGMALPSVSAAGPRVVGNHEIASTAAGLSVQSEQLAKQTRGAFGALLAVGIIQLIVSAIGYAVASNATIGIAPAVFIVAAGIGVGFLGLAAWARKSPFPAAIVGLVIYISLWALDGVVGVINGHPEVIAQGIILKLIIVGCLAKAVSAGVRHRAIRQQQANTAPAPAEQPRSMAA